MSMIWHVKKKYSEYFGFLDEEVDQLYDIYKKDNKESEDFKK